MTLTETREEFVRRIFEHFSETHDDRRLASTHSEYLLAYTWATRGVPLAVVCQGISDTSGKPRTLHACQRAVEAEIVRWASSMNLTTLPEDGPLEKPEP
jgi:hypothetical protein